MLENRRFEARKQLAGWQVYDSSMKAKICQTETELYAKQISDLFNLAADIIASDKAGILQYANSRGE